MDEARLAILKAEMDDCFREIGEVYGRIAQRKSGFRQDVEALDSMAYQLHNLYCAFERLFEVVAGFFENHVEGGRYHTDLLRRMRLEIEGIRPALISGEAFPLLDDLRRFRHFFRHAYAAELDVEKVAALVDKADRLKDISAVDCKAFLDRLRPSEV